MNANHRIKAIAAGLLVVAASSIRPGPMVRPINSRSTFQGVRPKADASNQLRGA